MFRILILLAICLTTGNCKVRTLSLAKGKLRGSVKVINEETDQHTRSSYPHNNNTETETKKICDQLKKFTPNLCSIYSAKTKCPVHCALPPALVKRELDCGKKFSQAESRKADKRIFGGKESQIGEWPWMVTIMTKSTVPVKYCSGAILSKDFILTAAHCFKEPGLKDPTKWQAISGNDHLVYDNKREAKHDVRKIMIHEDFGSPSEPSFSDIAVVQLGKSLDLKQENSNRLCLPDIDHTTVPGMTCYVAGWGKASSNETSTALILRQGALKLIEKYVCKLPNVIPGGIKDRELCAGWEDSRTDVCKGDSGGSLSCEIEGKWYAIGIISRGYKCGTQRGERNPFAALADVRTFKEWIVNAVLNDSGAL